MNELDLRSKVSAAIQSSCAPYTSEDDDKQGPPFAWCILNDQAQELFGRPAYDLLVRNVNP